MAVALNAFALYSPGSVFSAQTKTTFFSSPCFSLKLNYLPQLNFHSYNTSPKYVLLNASTLAIFAEILLTNISNKIFLY